MVNMPKFIKAFNKQLGRHTIHKVTQYKKGKESTASQGRRRYDNKQKGFGGQKKTYFQKEG